MMFNSPFYARSFPDLDSILAMSPEEESYFEKGHGLATALKAFDDCQRRVYRNVPDKDKCVQGSLIPLLLTDCIIRSRITCPVSSFEEVGDYPDFHTINRLLFRVLAHPNGGTETLTLLEGRPSFKRSFILTKEPTPQGTGKLTHLSFSVWAEYGPALIFRTGFPTSAGFDFSFTSSHFLPGETLKAAIAARITGHSVTSEEQKLKPRDFFNKALKEL